MYKRILLAAAILVVFGGFALSRIAANAPATGKTARPTAERFPKAALSKTPGNETAQAGGANPLPSPVAPREETPPSSENEPLHPSGPAVPPASEENAPAAFSPPEEPAKIAAGEFSWQPLIQRLEEDGFDTEYLHTAFGEVNSPPLPEFMAQKAIELYGRYGQASLAASEAEKLLFAPPDYSRTAGGMTVAAGRAVMDKNAKFFKTLYARYGVPAPVIVAVLMVETGIGAETGRQSALLALGSMAITRGLDNVLPVLDGIAGHHEELDELLLARSEWAYAELAALLTYARQSGKNAAAIPGSIYGAIGMCQFMPSNIPKFGVSTNAKRPVPDLFLFSDAAASVARYLSAHGWKKAETPQAQVSVLRSYNHSDIYASTVYGVAMSLMGPSNHRSAQAARKGGNAVAAARENAKAAIPAKAKKVKPLENLSDYSKLLE